MPIETMRYVPDDRIKGKHVVELSELAGSANGKGPFSYECAVCRKLVVEGSRVELVDVVLRCPHCGAYNETLRDSEIP